MKKNYTIFLILLIFSMSLSAQPVLNDTDFTSFYKYDGYYANNVVGLSPGSAGANQTWDFSGLSVPHSAGTYSVVPVALTPYAGDFPTANICFISPTVYFDDPYYYIYYKTSPTSFEAVGLADSTGSELFIDSGISFIFPYIYNTIINDTYQIYVGDDSSFSSTYDGYGTLITPFGTYSNVIRQKSVETLGAITYTDYSWFSTNPFKSIMEIYFTNDINGNSTNGVQIFSNFAPLSLTAFNKENSIKVYPNPTTSILNLHFSNAVTLDKLVIIDISGKTVMQQTKNITQINVEKLPAGVYILESYSGKDKFQSKFVKE